MINRIELFRPQFEEVFLTKLVDFIKPVKRSLLGSEQITGYETFIKRARVRILDKTPQNSRTTGRSQVDSIGQILVRVEKQLLNRIDESMLIAINARHYSIKQIQEDDSGIFAVLICEVLNSKVEIVK